MSETPAQTSEVELQDENSVPGTVHLVDIERELRAKHAGDSDIVLVPTPSNDVDDPLNWSHPRKALATICMCVYTITVGVASAAIYSVLVPISNDTGLSLDDLNAGTGYMFLLFGWGCLFWQPLALKYGKRSVYLISMLASVAVMVWTSFATSSNGQYLASKILQGFFGAPIESLVEISVTDVWFQHQRGTYIGIYAFSLAGSSYFAPIIAGFIADGQGWQWVFYWCAIFLAVGLVFNFFAMEETNYDRVYPISTPKSSSEKPSSDVAQLKEGERLCQNISPHQASQEGIVLSDPEPQITSSRKSCLQKLSILPQSRPLQFWKMVQKPLILLSFPIIFWAGFSYGSALIWFNVLNGTASSILSASPYSFSSSIVGVAYVSPFIGVCIGSLYLGRVSDWIPLKIARRKRSNAGIVEPEYRLWLFLVNAVFTPFSLILWGVGAAHGIHWFGLILSMGMTALTNCLGVQLSVLYAIDSYKELSSEALVTVILIRNTMSFALNYGLTPWITNMGLQNAFITAAFVGLMQALSFLVMVKWGKEFRSRSSKRYRRYVKESQSMGLTC